MKTRVSKALRRVPPSVREPLLSAAAVWRRADEVDLITAAGALDLDFYQAQTGETFDSVESASLHYLRKGRRAGRAPHPLFEPAVAQPTRWRGGGVDPLIENLRGRVVEGCGVHPTLPRSWAEPGPSGTPRWVEWLRNATDSTPMPVVGAATGTTTWGQFRAQSIEFALQGLHRRRIAGAARITSTAPPVDAGLDRAPLPESGGGAPIVSVVLPTWNRCGMIRRAVESVRAQTLTDWELIVVDDGSDDDTLLVLEGVTAHDPRVVVVAAAHGGVCRARNRAIAEARGRYLAFLDSDNVWNTDFLRRAVAYLHAEQGVWAHAAMQLERPDGPRYRWLDGDYELLLAGNYIDLNVMIAEREAVRQVGGFDETLRRAVDYDLVLKLARVAPPRLIPTIGTVYTDDEDVVRISTTEPMAWNEVVRVRHLVAGAPTLPVVAGRVTVVVPAKRPVADLADLMDALLGAAAGTHDDVQVVLVTAGTDDSTVRNAQLLACSRPGLGVVAWPTSNLELASMIDLGVTVATGEYVVTWHPNVRPTHGWAAPLLAALDTPGVALAQPLVLDANGLVRSGGAVFADGDSTPAPLLGGLAVEDAHPLGVDVVPAALAAVVAMRTETFRRLGGFDPIYRNAFAEVDLSLRARREGLGATVVVAAARVVHGDGATGFGVDAATSVEVLRQRHRPPHGSAAILRTVGFEQTGRRSVALNPDAVPEDVVYGAVPVLRPVPLGGGADAGVQVAESPPRLRWALDTAAPAGERGRGWGDVHFAGSLAAALQRLGQHVHVDRRTVRDGAHRDLDDVVVVLRGLDPVTPRPGTISLLWVISHPDLLTGAECAAHDQAFAASIRWAEWASERWGREIHPLLQCTDAQLFRPDAAEPDTGPELVFVGNSRGVYRPSLQYAVESGVTPAVWGHGWEPFLAPGLLTGEYFPNAELPALYAGAGAVLNDHWEDMRTAGFVSNRVFDVLASGGRLITDHVEGITELFGDAVRMFRTRADMGAALAGQWRERFPDHDARVRTAEHVRAQHSFDARAEVLLDTAVRVRATRRDTP